MPASFQLGTLAGIPLRMHVTFPLLLAWIGLSRGLERGFAAALSGVALVLAVFGFVVLHELGHALAARRLGIGTRDITLLPFGGLARLDRMPERPAHELFVALAGPAVNVLLAAILGALSVLTGTLAGAGWAGLPLQLMLINLMLAAFNLIPAFPMDGGRVLRALLASRVGFVRGTEIAAAVGRMFAIGFALAAPFVSLMLLLIAAFVWFAAGEESRRIRAAASAGSAWEPVGGDLRHGARVVVVERPLR